MVLARRQCRCSRGVREKGDGRASSAVPEAVGRERFCIPHTQGAGEELGGLAKKDWRLSRSGQSERGGDILVDKPRVSGFESEMPLVE